MSNHLVWLEWLWRGVVANFAMVRSLSLQVQCFHVGFSAELDRGTGFDANR